MCIRDRDPAAWTAAGLIEKAASARGANRVLRYMARQSSWSCLLYTSDAADERSSVDLGGRRIIKKKKKQTQDGNGDRI